MSPFDTLCATGFLAPLRFLDRRTDSDRRASGGILDHMRTLHFPSAQSLGQLTVQGGAEEDVTVLGEAKGTVSVPDIGQLTLNVTQDTLARLPALSMAPVDSLHGIVFVACEIDDLSLFALQRLMSLRTLDFYDCTISNGGLAPLGMLSHLQALAFDTVIADDVAWEPLRSLVSLKALHILRSPFDDGALSIVRGWTLLQTLVLSGTEVSDNGLSRSPEIWHGLLSVIRA